MFPKNRIDPYGPGCEDFEQRAIEFYACILSILNEGTDPL